jgi:hypothetical protein
MKENWLLFFCVKHYFITIIFNIQLFRDQQNTMVKSLDIIKFFFHQIFKCNYRLFDPEDYAYGFRIVPENTESLTRSTEIAKVSVLHPVKPRPFKVDGR